MAKQQYPTNMIVLKATRKKPKSGDLFVCNLRGERWIAGRVIHDQCAAMGGNGNEFLLYFYSMAVDHPRSVRPPIQPDLLIPPKIVNALPWRIGLFETLANYPLEPQERLPRHCFRRGSIFCDEFRREITAPEPGEPCSVFGLGGYLTVDEALSNAIGMPIAFDIRTGEAPSVGQEEAPVEVPAVVVMLPAEPSSDLDLDLVEEPLINAVEQAAVGTWEGHGINLRSGMCEVRFRAADPEALARVVLPLLRGMKLPKGAYLIKSVPKRAPVRIDL